MKKTVKKKIAMKKTVTKHMKSVYLIWLKKVCFLNYSNLKKKKLFYSNNKDLEEEEDDEEFDPEKVANATCEEDDEEDDIDEEEIKAISEGVEIDNENSNSRSGLKRKLDESCD